MRDKTGWIALAVVVAAMAYVLFATGGEELIPPNLKVFALDDGNIRELASGEAVASGTPIVFRYRTAQHARAWLVVVDDGIPSTPWKSAPLPPGDYEVGDNDEAMAWMVDGDLELGLLLTSPTHPGVPTLGDCTPDAACTRFVVKVAD